MIRGLWMILILSLVFAGTRGLIRALPGDPLETLIAETGTSLPREALRAELGLDRPFLAALAGDTRRALGGDIGVSLVTRQPIAPVLGARALKTFQLTLFALSLGVAFSLVLGLAAAGGGDSPANRWADRACSWHGALAAALPTTWIGPMLAYVFALKVPVLPLGGHIALPALTLAIGFSGLWARLIRERVRETLLTGAAPGARARGVPEWKVLLKYGLAPAAGPLAAYLGTQLGALMAGAFVTEVIFDWPGLGSWLIDSVLRRDYPVVEAAVFFAAAASLLGTWLGDWGQAALDPRRRSE